MPVDMKKKVIAQAAMKLFNREACEKLTVKDIVEECPSPAKLAHYHFADIPEMFRWILEQQGQRALAGRPTENRQGRKGLRCLFVMALEAMPYLRRVERTFTRGGRLQFG